MREISIYDEVAFPSLPHAASHPARLATIARLRGVPAAPLESCRVLELGCGTGGNLLPLAESLPGSQCLGIDLSAQQIRIAEQNVQAAGIPNVHFLVRDIVELDLAGQTFDYILCHGVYSWTTEPVRRRIFALCGECLSPHGIAYVNYNAYPGWHLQTLVRDALSCGAHRLTDPADRVGAARQAIDLLLAVLPAEGPHHAWLRNELEAVRRHSDAYLFHAYLNITNQPFYLREVVDRGAEHGLSYVGDAEPGAMWPAVFLPQFRTPVSPGGLGEPAAADGAGTAAALVAREQFFDFARFCSSRRSLFCREGVTIREWPADDLRGLHFSAPLRRQDASPDSPAGSWTFTTPHGQTVTTSEPRLRSTLKLLADAWPESRPWEWLATQVAQQGESPGMPLTATSEWCYGLVRCFAMGALEISVQPNPCTGTVADTPRATRWARHQAAVQPMVTNLRHAAVRLDALERTVLRQLDGHHTLQAIEDALRRDPAQGPVRGEMMHRALARLAASALLWNG